MYAAESFDLEYPVMCLLNQTNAYNFIDEAATFFMACDSALQESSAAKMMFTYYVHQYS